MPMMPARKSMTRRRDHAALARKRLAAYAAKVDARKVPTRVPGTDTIRPTPRDEGNVQSKVMDLLWVQALVARALYLETGGLLGDRNATPDQAAVAAVREAVLKAVK